MVNQAANPLAAATRAMDEGKYDDAIADFGRVPPSDPSYLDAQYLIGVATERKGDRAGALKHLLAVRARDPVAFARDVQGSPSGSRRMEYLASLYAQSVQVWRDEAIASIDFIAPTREHLVLRNGHTLSVINKSDRRLLWETSALPGLNMTPAVTDSTVYAVTRPRGKKSSLEALAIATGKVIWSRELPRDSHRFTPAVDERTLYMGDTKSTHEGLLLALDRNSGAMRWSAPVDGELGPIAVSQTHICTATFDRVVSCYDKASGKRTSKQDLPELAIGSLAIDAGKVFVSTRTGTYAVNVAGDPALAWKNPQRSASSPFVSTGKAVITQTHAALTVMNPQTGESLATFDMPKLDESSHALQNAPRLRGEAVLGVTRKGVFAFGNNGPEWALSTAQFATTTGVSAEITAPPATDADGNVFVGTQRGLYAFKPAPWSRTVASATP